jgi:hypothetical protein
MPAPRMEQPLVERRLIAQQQQPLALRIEPPNRIHARRKPKLRQRSMPRAVGRELREDAVRFVEGEEHGEGRMTNDE